MKTVRLASSGAPLGMLPPGLPYTETRVRLEPGDTLLLYSDGVIDAQNVAGEESAKIVSVPSCRRRHVRVAELIANVFGQIDAFAAAAPQFDDITLLAISRLPSWHGLDEHFTKCEEFCLQDRAGRTSVAGEKRLLHEDGVVRDRLVTHARVDWTAGGGGVQHRRPLTVERGGMFERPSHGGFGIPASLLTRICRDECHVPIALHHQHGAEEAGLPLVFPNTATSFS